MDLQLQPAHPCRLSYIRICNIAASSCLGSATLLRGVKEASGMLAHLQRLIQHPLDFPIRSEVHLLHPCMLDCKGHSLHLWLHSFDFCAGLGALCASVKFIALAFADYCRRNLGQCCVLSRAKTCSHVIGLTRLSLSITGRFSSVQFPRAFSRLLSLWRGGCEAKDLHTSRHHDCVPLTLAWYFQDLFFCYHRLISYAAL